LAVDMLTHGFNGNMGKAVLVDGDLDFRPVVESLVRAGVFVEVWYEPRSAARELPGAADYGRKLDFSALYRWSDYSFQSNYHRPEGNNGTQSVAGSTTVRTGTFDGRPANLVLTPTGDYILSVDQANGSYWLKHRQRDVLERFASISLGTIQW